MHENEAKKKGIKRDVAMKFPEWFYFKPRTCKRNSLLRGVTFEVETLTSYVLSPAMLLLLETFMDLLLWNSFQCRRHIFFVCFHFPEIFVP
jgi:hypothetical protein